jgi:hypothetical protein
MATPDITAGAVMDASAALLNDVQKQVYSYTAQIPYLRIAFRELRESLELANIPVTNKVSSTIVVPASTTPNSIVQIGFTTSPALPSDLIEIQQIFEAQTGTDVFVPMVKKEFIPLHMLGVSYQQFMIWAWVGNNLNLLPCVQSNTLRMNYIQQLADIVDENSTLGITNGQSFLEFRNAALCAEFVGENNSRAEALNHNAQLSIDRLSGIEAKARQNVSTRHRPFRMGFKSRRGTL